MGDPVDTIRGLCDALEWHLVPWGHRHTGLVRVSYVAPVAALAWTNKATTDGGLWTLDRPEASLHLEVHPDGRPEHTTGGSQAWVLGSAGPLARRLCRAIAARGWAVQSIDAGGVVVAEVGR